MAEHKHGSMDTRVQEQTFSGFIKILTWVVIAILAVLVLMAVFTS